MNRSKKLSTKCGSDIPMNPCREPSPQGGEATYEELSESQLQKENVYTIGGEFVPAAHVPATHCGRKDAEKKEQKSCCKKGCPCFCTVVLFAFSLTATACIVFLFLEIETLKSELVTKQNLSALQIQTSQLNKSTDILHQLFEQLTITSCADLPPSAPSGYYLIRSSSLHVYCDMSRTCGGVTGGWMRVFELDMTITSHQCPNGFSQRTDGGLRTCVRNVSAAGCSSIFLPTRNVNYSRVCGRITGYQVGTTDDFLLQSSIDINSIYVDDVSLTHGLSPRQHVWTFAVAVQKSGCPFNWVMIHPHL